MDWLLIAAWGGFVGLDATSLLQVMVSRPFIAAAVTGLLLGDPVAGATIGAVLEAFALSSLPIGAAQYPDAGPAAVAATGAYLTIVESGISATPLLLAVLFALGWERLGGATVSWLRHGNERIAAVAPEQEEVEPGWIVRRHALAVLLDLVRAVVVTLLGWAVGTLLLYLGGRLDELGHFSLEALSLGAAGMMGCALSLFGTLRERRVPFLAGLIVGALLLWAR